MAKVSIVRVEEDLEASVAKAFLIIGEKIVAHGDTVLIKPNLVEPADPESGQITTPRVIEAVAKYCLDAGALKVIIGEGPGYYQPNSYLRQCFTKTGVADVAKRLGIEWVLFDEHKYRRFPGVPDCIARDFHVTEYAFNCDKLIDLPVLKAHWLTRVTLGMKNLKGCLKWEDKPLFHRLDLERAVIELNKIVRPAATIIDGTPASITRQMGAGAARWKDGAKGLLIAGTDVVATDAVGAAIMGIDPSSVNLLTYGTAAGLGENDLARIDIAGEELKRIEFKPQLPEEELRATFPGLRIYGANKACCGCLIPLLSSLKSMSGTVKKSGELCSIYIGEKPDNIGDNALTIGECARVENSETESVRGCPPEKDEIRRALSSIFPAPD
jgi:uncharacterized protein (DUF362 family)